MAAARGDVTDLLGAYARPLPIAVLCELLGIPAADRVWIEVTTAAAYDGALLDRVGSLGLRFCSADLVLTPDHQHVFLDLNPQWAVAVARAGGGIATQRGHGPAAGRRNTRASSEARHCAVRILSARQLTSIAASPA